jgi:hypothetical protein
MAEATGSQAVCAETEDARTRVIAVKIEVFIVTGTCEYLLSNQKRLMMVVLSPDCVRFIYF